MSTPAHTALDRFACEHLLAWCESKYRQSYEADCAFEEYLNAMSEEDRADTLERGWPAMADRYESENPDHFACFNS